MLTAKLYFRLKQEVVNGCLLAEGKTVASLYWKRDELKTHKRKYIS